MGKLEVKKSYFKYIILLIVLIPIVYFIQKTDFKDVQNELSKINYRFIYIIFITFLAYIIGTWAWYVCLGSEKIKISIMQLFVVRQVGETVGLYNPTSIIGGDLLKSKFLAHYGISNKSALNSVVISRITAILSQMLLLTMALLWLLCFNKSFAVISNIKAIICAGISCLVILQIVLFYWLSNKKNQEKPTLKTGNLWRKVKSNLNVLLFDMKFFYQKENRIFWQSYLLFGLHWFVGSMEFYFILHFLGFPINLFTGLLLDMNVIVFKSIGAIIPGQIGIEEIGNKLTLRIIGITSETIWISVSILRRMRQLFWIAIGVILYLFIKKENKYGYVSS